MWCKTLQMKVVVQDVQYFVEVASFSFAQSMKLQPIQSSWRRGTKLILNTFQEHIHFVELILWITTLKLDCCFLNALAINHNMSNRKLLNQIILSSRLLNQNVANFRGIFSTAERQRSCLVGMKRMTERNISLFFKTSQTIPTGQANVINVDSRTRYNWRVACSRYYPSWKTPQICIWTVKSLSTCSWLFSQGFIVFSLYLCCFW